MKKIKIINGPNLNRLGKRDEEKYGSFTLEELEKELREEFSDDCQLSFFQSQLEGEIIQELYKEDGTQVIVINAGGYTHTSVAIRDAIDTLKTPVIEVHISNISSRESFRHTSLLSPVVDGVIFGFKKESYFLAVIAAIRLISKNSLNER